MDKAAGIVMLVLGLIVCAIGGASMMAEGPHGPHGEITGDPKNLPVVAIALVVGGVLFVVGIGAMLPRKTPEDEKWRKRD